MLNPVIMSKTVRVSPRFVLVAVSAGASIGGWLGGIFGGFVAALLAIPTAAALQTVIRDLWRESGPDSSSPSGNGNLPVCGCFAVCPCVARICCPQPRLRRAHLGRQHDLEDPRKSASRPAQIIWADMNTAWRAE